MKKIFCFGILLLVFGLLASCTHGVSFKTADEVNAIMRSTNGVHITEFTSLDGSFDLASNYIYLEFYFYARPSLVDSVKIINTYDSNEYFGSSIIHNVSDDDIQYKYYSFYFGPSGTLMSTQFEGFWYYAGHTAHTVSFKTRPSLPSSPMRYLTFSKI